MAQAWSVKNQMPLKDRTIQSKKNDKLQQPASVERSQKNWKDDPNIRRAVFEIKRTGKSVRKVAMEYGIPNSTLQASASRKILIGSSQGPAKYLTDKEEQALEQSVLGCADVRYPQTVTQVFRLLLLRSHQIV